MASSATGSSIPAVTNPGFGFVIISRPLTSNFSRVGSYFAVSHLEDFDYTQPITICVWLGTEPVDQIKTQVVLVVPGKGIIPITMLDQNRLSSVTTLDLNSGMNPTNTLMYELFAISEKPCLLFIRQGDHPDSLIEKEGQDLSFINLALKMVNACHTYLDGNKVEGDALHSSALAKWFLATSRELDGQSPTRFLFDPTLLAAGIVRDLGKTLLDVNRFDIDLNEVILIPMVFIRNWAARLTGMLQGEQKDGVVRNLLRLE
ncbi:hypothetical protein GALMADRAFT_139071 [Galerina marginata CBS 339.88]|uniref:Uncharacterized protein n=1 Tax=Galerina marginata (strain CBS 339.88) TaxID=685588 RepID=A0A067T401_GALM3|nr:hypothetical protein GALMADRAFT_139071 [Galerina marginata CBS 339.88]